MSAWAGTFRDNFDDGNWEVWEVVAAGMWETNVEDRVSVVERVLRLEHLNTEPGPRLVRDEDWKDYSFSADMRIVEVEPGHP